MVAFLSGAVLTAANLNSAFNALTFRAVTGTSDTFVLADNGGAVSYSNASPITATVPPFSSVAYANGTVIQLLNLGAGVVTVTAGVGVTLNGSSVTLAQNAGGTLIKTATNTWYFLPNGGGGKILQVVRATDSTNRTVTSNTVTDASISVTITPQRSTSNIMLVWTAQISPAAADYTILLITDNSNVAISGAEFNYNGGSQSGGYFSTVNIAWASPGTTSAVTYKGRWRSNTVVTSTLQNANSTGQLFAIEVEA